jgi:hypothetical protein
VLALFSAKNKKIMLQKRIKKNRRVSQTAKSPTLLACLAWDDIISLNECAFFCLPYFFPVAILLYWIPSFKLFIQPETSLFAESACWK